MDDLRTRLDTLEQQTAALAHHSRQVTRQLRWWRGVAGGLMVLAVLTWALPVVTADDAQPSGKKGLEQRVAALETLLKHFSRNGNEVFITKANLHIRNGLGSTDCTDAEGEPIPDCPNGLGNLIVGYNEVQPGFCVIEDIVQNGNSSAGRTGSHNVVVGQANNFSRFGGLVVGNFNTISGDFAVASGGICNVASGPYSLVNGGRGNAASWDLAVVSGGEFNRASEFLALVSGGRGNAASGVGAVVSGGDFNTASGLDSAVSGGEFNTASGDRSWVGGGSNNTASGRGSSISGGESNTAAGDLSSVSGGSNRTADGEFDWVAGSLFEDE